MEKIAFFLICIAILLSGALASHKYSYDGKGNNVDNPDWGASERPAIRKVPVAFEDGISIPVGGLNSNLPSTRHISNLLFGREMISTRKANTRKVTDILTFWGQFIDHDLTYSPIDVPCVKFPIPIPKGDPFYDVENEGGKIMNFCRTEQFKGTGTSKENHRRETNLLTPWLDGSSVYGHTEPIAKALRTFKGGLLKTSLGPDGELPPLNRDTNGKPLIKMANPAKRVNVTKLFACGDQRCNENPVLLAIHTLFVREHNRRARALPKKMSDEDKFQEARRFVIAHIQAITMNEYAPALMGTGFPPYKGYNKTLNPQTSSFFSTVAFRYGHDEVNSVIQRLNPDGTPIKEGPILLRDCYFWPLAVENVGIGPYLRGASVNPQHSVDGMLTDDLRNFLFGQVPGIATDLAARNLQRGRDHGIARYNQCREAYNLPTITKFEELTNDKKVVRLLNEAYDGKVENLDPYIGSLLEPKKKDSNLGELFTVSIKEQFFRIRHGDRFWYENKDVFSSKEKNEIDSTTLSDLIKRNTDTPNIPKSIFFRKERSPSAAFSGGDQRQQTNKTRKGPKNKAVWISAIVILFLIVIALVVVILVILFRPEKPSHNQGNELYSNLLKNDTK